MKINTIPAKYQVELGVAVELELSLLEEHLKNNDLSVEVRQFLIQNISRGKEVLKKINELNLTSHDLDNYKQKLKETFGEGFSKMYRIMKANKENFNGS